MDLLGLLNGGLSAVNRAKSAQLEGAGIKREREQADLLAQVEAQRQAQKDAQATEMQGLQKQNLLSLIEERSRVTAPARRTQVVDGQLVDLDAGTAAPIQGYRAAPKQSATPAAGSFTQFVGPDGKPTFFNPQTGATVTAPDGMRPASAATGNPTEGERKNAGLTLSGEEGYRNLSLLLDGGDDPNTPEVENLPAMVLPTMWDKAKSAVGAGIGNAMSRPQIQQMEQAAYDLQEAWMRLTSGGAIQPEEIRQASKALIPQPGDGPAVLAQKARARKVRIDALRLAAGRALPTSGSDESASGSVTTSTGRTFQKVQP